MPRDESVHGGTEQSTEKRLSPLSTSCCCNLLLRFE